MRITTKGRYGLNVMLDLATYGADNYVSLKDISGRLNITIKYLEQIVTPLNKAGFLSSMRGNSGGHKLAKPACEYIVGDILRVMEGDLAPIECLAGSEIECPHQDSCVTLPFWKGLDRVINDYVDSFTLQDLLNQRLGINN